MGPAIIQDWAKALRLHTERSVPKASPKAVASPTSPSKEMGEQTARGVVKGEVGS